MLTFSVSRSPIHLLLSSIHDLEDYVFSLPHSLHSVVISKIYISFSLLQNSNMLLLSTNANTPYHIWRLPLLPTAIKYIL